MDHAGGTGRQITVKECGAIEESFYNEHLLGAKCLHWAAATEDEDLRRHFHHIAETCQTHVRELTALLQTPVVQ